MNPKMILAALGIDLNEVQENAKRIVAETQAQIKALHDKMDTVNASVESLRKTIEAHYGRDTTGDNSRRGNAHGSDGGTDAVARPNGGI